MMKLSTAYWYLGRGKLTRTRETALKVARPHGLLTPLPAPPYVYVHAHYTYVPYRVQRWQEVQQSLFLALDHIDMLRTEKGPTYHEIFLAWPWLQTQLKSSCSLDNLFFCVGFTVSKRNGTLLGKVVRIEKRPLQHLLVVQDDDTEVMIPVHKTFILAIDWDKQEVKVSWPPR